MLINCNTESLLFTSYFSSSSFVVEKTKSEGNSGHKTKKDHSQSYNEENEIEISVILDNVPDHYHIPGVTQIVTE